MYLFVKYLCTFSKAIYLKYLVLILISTWLIGCYSNVATPVSDTPAATQTSQPVGLEDPTAKIPVITDSPPQVTQKPTDDPDELLRSSIANLVNAASFQLAAVDIRSYRIIESTGATRLIYGEFHTSFDVITLPTVKVHGHSAYRYNSQDSFLEYDRYVYQENNQYYTQLIEGLSISDAEEINPEQIEPMAGDVYRTIVSYGDQAHFVEENDGIAVYLLEHPCWYELTGAIGFANLGFLATQENGQELIKQYVEQNFPDVETINFTLYVDTAAQQIMKVKVDDADFMRSVWEEVDRALIEQGAASDLLSHYEVLPENGAEYIFSHYNEVQDFEIPSHLNHLPGFPSNAL